MTWAFALLAFAALTYTTADADLWGHLRFGLDLLRDHHLTSVDPYSFTQDRPWINHEWLSELQTAIAWRVAGPAGLALLKGALAFIAVALFWTTRRDVRLSVKAIVLVVLAVGTVHITSSIRPQVWTFACAAVLCRSLLTAGWRYKRWLPLLFVFWANCHGGWFVGLAVLSLWAAVESAQARGSLRGWIVIVPCSLAATWVNPYGWTLWQFLIETVRPSRGTNIIEWRPVFETSASNWIPWLIVTLGALWAVGRARDHRLPIGAVLTLLAYGSFRVMRVESLFIEAAAILLMPVLADVWPARAVPRTLRTTADRAALGFLCVLPLGAAVWLLTITLACVPDISMFNPDLAAVRALAHAGTGRMVTYFNWGQYAIWHFGPRLRVSMDGRRETVYSDETLAAADDILYGRPPGLATLDRWGAEYVWLPEACQVTRAWLARHGYRIDVETSDSFVAVRADLPTLPSNSAGEAARRRCFPD